MFIHTRKMTNKDLTASHGAAAGEEPCDANDDEIQRMLNYYTTSLTVDVNEVVGVLFCFVDRTTEQDDAGDDDDDDNVDASI